ncbi:hypothetical protein RIF23_12900 [Lipingzhangella sp. LS1_29]|uniref:Uncharacterized protein n=1 Tax=Lipingzhangella rawalii TaxID=2055835 RepID=A0ABU2H8L1_9ACTN|nr:hypothetical protein [Lipingzhangella rawalii]MDS1271194.1 hypothetical protein [Lipingzhangella rawalii]
MSFPPSRTPPEDPPLSPGAKLGVSLGACCGLIVFGYLAFVLIGALFSLGGDDPKEAETSEQHQEPDDASGGAEDHGQQLVDDARAALRGGNVPERADITLIADDANHIRVATK